MSKKCLLNRSIMGSTQMQRSNLPRSSMIDF